MISQHCLNDLRGPCPDPNCSCDCHVQTSWVDRENARIAGITQDKKRPDRECANTSTGPNHDAQIKETS